MKLNKKNYLLAVIAVIIVGSFVLGGYLWNSQVKELKLNRSANEQRIQELERKLQPSEEDNSSNELNEVKDFVTIFYNDRIEIIRSTQGTSDDEQGDRLNELENGRVTTKLKNKLSEPAENDRFFCVNDPVFSLLSVSPTKLESSYTVKVTVGLGIGYSEGNHDITVDVIKTDDGFKFDSTDCSQ